MKSFFTKNKALADLLGSLAILAAVCTFHFLAPKTMHEPDSWAYYYSAENFSKGKLVVDAQIHERQVETARTHPDVPTSRDGGQLIQYLEFNSESWSGHHWENMWYLEKAPGYPLLLSWWHKLGIADFFPVLLGAAVTLVLALVGRAFFPTRMGGTLLNFFYWLNPLTLTMFHRTYMAGFSAAAFLVIGAGLAIWYGLKKETLSNKEKFALFLLSGASLGLSCLIQYTNTIFLPIIGIYLLFKAFSGRKKDAFGLIFWVVPLIWCALILGAYNTYLFGSLLDYGYKFSPFSTSASFSFLAFITNLKYMPYYIITAIPILAVCILALFFKTPKKESSQPNRIDKSTWILLALWTLAVIVFNLFYEWTAQNYSASTGTLRMALLTRFYLPIVFPFAILTAKLMLRLPKTLKYLSSAVIIVFSTLSFWQYVLAVNNPPPPTEQNIKIRRPYIYKKFEINRGTNKPSQN